MYIDYIENELGIFEIVANETSLIAINYVTLKKITNSNDITRKTKQELNDYFLGNNKQFTCAISFSSTPFRELVWKALLEIPYGKTRTYGEIAKTIGKPKSSRAVGQAIHHNPLMIVVPCHRVIGKNKNMVGYAWGINLKEKLLQLENK